MPEISIIPGTIKLVRMDDKDYFALKNYISNSKLSLINPDEDGSFEKYETGFQSGYSDSFALGSAIHGKVLQPDDYVIADITKPNGKLGLFIEKVFELRQVGLPIQHCIDSASEIVDYYKGKLTTNRLKIAIKTGLPFYKQRMNYELVVGKETIFLSDGLKEKFNQCMDNIENKSTGLMKKLYPEGIVTNPEVFNEYAIFCDIQYVDTETGEITILPFKAKLDNFTLDHENEIVTLNDLKTTSKPASYFMGNHVDTHTIRGEETTVWYNGSFQHYHYYRQMAVYTFLLSSALRELKNINYTFKSNMLVVETTPEYKCKIHPVNGKHIAVGWEEFKNLLTLVVEWMQQKSMN